MWINLVYWFDISICSEHSYIPTYICCLRQTNTYIYTYTTLASGLLCKAWIGWPAPSSVLLLSVFRRDTRRQEVRKSHLFSGSTEVSHGCWSKT
jgi:hypothetical protein